jgi:AraC family transcriptional regulator of adaptative response/methylated-DNA-[protein]-cysteine methyltransferase
MVATEVPGPESAAAPDWLGCAIRGCRWGVCLIAATESGVRAVLLGDEPPLDDLRRRWPTVELRAEHPTATRWAASVVAAVDRPGAAPDVPLDLQGTPFQRRVWDALRQVPRGRLTTYADLATAIGSPAAVRAVAGACAANPVAVLVPCHRVRRRDGGWAGYRWGRQRKQRLVAAEREQLILPLA